LRSKKELIYNSTDINLLLKEIQKVQDCLTKIKEMKQGMLGSAMIQIENEVKIIYGILNLPKFLLNKYTF
jgi:hypothetical protein